MYHHSDHKISPAENGLPTKIHDEETELPTRVLAVGTPNLHLECPQEDKEGKRPKGKYLTLSHCWGTDRKKLPLQTTKGNLEAYKLGIEFDQLPKSFQDAVTIARKIDVQYLWIDSLCIIQDDRADWEKESQKMAQVFSSAYCTISATSAKNSHEGFLSFPKQKVVKIIDGETSRFAVYASIVDKSFKQAVDEDGLLNKRGWVFQERALSRRTIHFTESRTFWECGSAIRYDNLSQLTR